MVFGLAAATWLTRVFWSAERSMFCRSPPSEPALLTNTTAVLAARAASSPITVMKPDPSGSAALLFFNSTLLSCATWRAAAVCASEVTTELMVPVGEWSNSPARNIATRMARTWLSIVATDTCPLATAWVSGAP